MPQLPSPLTTAEGTRAIDSNSIGKFGASRLHFPSLDALHDAAAAGASLSWPDGLLMTCADEADVSAHRVYRSALGHGRTVQIGLQRTVLTGNANRLWASIGAPDSGVGSNGDIAIDSATGSRYKKQGGLWVDASEAPSPSLTPVLLANDTIWGQWVEQVLLVAPDYMLVGLAGTAGEKRLARISRPGLTHAVLTIPGGTFEVDDHDVVGCALLANGRAITGFSRHSIVGTSQVYYRIATDGTATSWGALQTLTTSSQPSYMQLWTVGSRTFMFYRVGNSSVGYWVMRWTDDNAATWTGEVQVTPVAYLGTRVEGTTIHCAMYGHPVSSSDKKVYTFVMDTVTGNVRANGEVISNFNSPPMSGDATPVQLPLATTSNTRIAINPPGMVRMFARGADFILGCEFPGAGSVGTYCHYQRVGDTGLYDRRVVGSAGRPFKGAPNGYFNGICAVGPNDLVAAVSESSAAGVGPSRLERWVAPSSTAPFVLDKVLHSSSETLARPMYGGGLLMWDVITRYPDYDDFDAFTQYAVLG